jgi:uncharacterized membrane-anchored protein
MSATTANQTVLLNRVPKVTFDFWIIKLLAVTMGETAADYLAVNMGLGLTATSLIMAAVLTQWPIERRVGRWMLIAVAVFGMANFVFGISL